YDEDSSLPSRTLASSFHFLIHSKTSARSRTFFFIYTTATDLYTLSLHDALPIWQNFWSRGSPAACSFRAASSFACSAAFCSVVRSEEHTSELQSLRHLVCRLLLEKKKAESGTVQI